ncbi:MAG: 3-methyl-2-oxobutanoate hydroxymethyltransferase [Methylococcales bacterium]
MAKNKTTPLSSKPLTINSFSAMKGEGEKITCLTAYDASFAGLLDESGIEILLVGDTLGMVVQGQASTLPVTVDEIIYHTRCVVRGRQRAFVMADLPFGSYSTPTLAIQTSSRILKEGCAEMVKLEGAGSRLEIVRHLVDQGIPVCGHIGLLPQSINQLGGYFLHGKTDESARTILADAKLLEEAGASMLLLECIESGLAAEITGSVTIPTIGIGSGCDCDGQVLVLYDMLDITLGFKPSFSKNFMAGKGSVSEAVEAYVVDVKAGRFPPRKVKK